MPRKEVCRANYNIAKEEMLSTILQDLDVLDEAWQAGEDPSSVLKDLQASAFAYKFELLARYGRWQEAMACLDDCRRHYKSLPASLFQRFAHVACSSLDTPAERKLGLKHIEDTAYDLSQWPPML
jgi:hypothetical protein